MPSANRNEMRLSLLRNVGRFNGRNESRCGCPIVKPQEQRPGHMAPSTVFRISITLIVSNCVADRRCNRLLLPPNTFLTAVQRARAIVTSKLERKTQTYLQTPGFETRSRIRNSGPRWKQTHHLKFFPGQSVVQVDGQRTGLHSCTNQQLVAEFLFFENRRSNIKRR